MNLLLFISLLSISVINCEKNIHEVVIIGAGPSGIAAATKLLKNNIHDIRILEAENRIGGRINSVKFGEGYVDLGAEWCCGEKDNIIYSLVKDYNILKTTKFSPKVWYSSNGLIDNHIQNDINNVRESLKFLFYKDVEEKYKNASVKEIFLKNYKNNVLQKYSNDKTRLNIVKDVINYFQHYVSTVDSVFDWNNLSIESNRNYCEGQQWMNWNGEGFKTILDVLMQKYPDPKNALPINDKILLNKPVKSINWKTNSKQLISIKCQDGTQYEANYVIFTPSVGVLKTQHSSLFEPQLPTNKIKAIENIGIGAIIKVILQFDRKWWKNDDYTFSFVWSREDNEKLFIDLPNEPSKNGAHWLTALNTVFQADNNPKVLHVWLCGENVPEIEKLTDQQIENGVMYGLRHFLEKDYNISDPIAMIRTSWWSNPHFHGSWSYDTVKGKALGINLQKNLAEPLALSGNEENNLQLLFGGEATNSKYYSTVHGAIESGRREANRVIESIKMKNNM